MADKDSSISTESNILLVSYDLWCSNTERHSMFGLKKRVVALAEGLKESDIVSLQEMYNS